MTEHPHPDDGLDRDGFHALNPRETFYYHRWFVPGVPQPKGNLRRNPHTGALYDANPQLQTWMDSIVLVVTASRPVPFPASQPVRVDRSYVMPRPASHWSGRTEGTLTPAAADTYWHRTKPDLDKLDRAVFDALTRSGLIRDDSRIAGGNHWKVYAAPGQRVGLYLRVAGLAS
jgi:Holliday junction resolvase RusA-like endonuclease